MRIQTREVAVLTLGDSRLTAEAEKGNRERFWDLTFGWTNSPRMAASGDKDFVVIEGALHGFTLCIACEQFPGQYSNTVKNLFDYAAAWINARF
jgi:hypothetical protein